MAVRLVLDPRHYTQLVDEPTQVRSGYVLPELQLTCFSIIVNSFGFTILQTTLLGCVDGVITSKSKPSVQDRANSLTSRNNVVRRSPSLEMEKRTKLRRIGLLHPQRPRLDPSHQQVYVSFCKPVSDLAVALPWANQIGLLFSLWITEIGATGFVISLGWVTAVTAGHTKRITSVHPTLITKLTLRTAYSRSCSWHTARATW